MVKIAAFSFHAHIFSKTRIGGRKVRREPITGSGSNPPSLLSNPLDVPVGPNPPSTPLVVLVVVGLNVVGVDEFGVVLELAGVVEVPAALMQRREMENKVRNLKMAANYNLSVQWA